MLIFLIRFLLFTKQRYRLHFGASKLDLNLKGILSLDILTTKTLMILF
jgi:hypothetical protein